MRARYVRLKLAVAGLAALSVVAGAGVMAAADRDTGVAAVAESQPAQPGAPSTATTSAQPTEQARASARQSRAS
jgi:hypothetical protein